MIKPQSIPKAFRIANNKKLIAGISEGNTINTPSMICVEDCIDSLNWVESIWGLSSIIYGDYSDIMSLLNTEVKEYMTKYRSIFVFKLGKGTLSYTNK